MADKLEREASIALEKAAIEAGPDADAEEVEELLGHYTTSQDVVNAAMDIYYGVPS